MVHFSPFCCRIISLGNNRLNSNPLFVVACSVLLSIVGYAYAMAIGIKLPWCIDAAVIAMIFLGGTACDILYGCRRNLQYG